MRVTQPSPEGISGERISQQVLSGGFVDRLSKYRNDMQIIGSNELFIRISLSSVLAEPLPVIMDSPDPQYFRPSISAETHASLGVLASACRSGDVEEVKKLAARNDSGISLAGYLTYGLVATINADQIEVVRYLLDHGADPNDRGVTMMAANARSLPIFEALLEKGWDINILILQGISTLS